MFFLIFYMIIYSQELYFVWVKIPDVSLMTCVVDSNHLED